MSERVWHKSSCRGALGGCGCVLVLVQLSRQHLPQPHSLSSLCLFHLESQDGRDVRDIPCGLVYLCLQVM